MQFSFKVISIISISTIAIFLYGCTDSDYQSGMYWLEKENNPQMAARTFQRSIAKKPGRWKSHYMALKTLAMAEDVLQFRAQLVGTLERWPDSSRSEALFGPGVLLLGEEDYNKLSAPYAQQRLGVLLSKKGDTPELLSKIIMASCRMKDTVAANDYFIRLLSSLGNLEPSDLVVQELSFLIGPARVDWIKLERTIERNPQNIEARMSQLDAGIVMGDSVYLRNKLKELIKVLPEDSSIDEIVRRFGRVVGVDPFAGDILLSGWDGSYSPDLKHIVYIKDLGKFGESDPYIYMASARGTNERPLMKGRQQRILSIALPRYSPRGNWIYFYGSPNAGWTPERNIGRCYLYRMRPQYGYQPQKLTEANLIPVPPYFDSEGGILLVRRDIGSARASIEIIKLTPGKKKLESISRIGEPVNGAVFTPDGDSLIFTTDRGIFRRSVRGDRISVDLKWRGLTNPQLSPDGSKLFASNRVGHGMLIDRETGKITFLGSTAVKSAAFGKSDELLITQYINNVRSLVKLNLSTKQAPVDKFLAAIDGK